MFLIGHAFDIITIMIKKILNFIEKTSNALVNFASNLINPQKQEEIPQSGFTYYDPNVPKYINDAVKKHYIDQQRNKTDQYQKYYENQSSSDADLEIELSRNEHAIEYFRNKLEKNYKVDQNNTNNLDQDNDPKTIYNETETIYYDKLLTPEQNKIMTAILNMGKNCSNSR